MEYKISLKLCITFKYIYKVIIWYFEIVVIINELERERERKEGREKGKTKDKIVKNK